MMHDPSIFIDSKLPIQDLTLLLEEILELSFVRRPADRDDEVTFIHDGNELGLHLYEHGLEDNIGIPFGRYRYSLRRSGRADA